MNGSAHAIAQRNKARSLESLRVLLDVPGAEVEWPNILRRLSVIPGRVLHSLDYRVRAALENAYSDGQRDGRDPRTLAAVFDTIDHDRERP